MSQTKRGTTPVWVAPFLQSLRDGIGVHAASEAVGVSSSTIYRRRDLDPAFKAAWDAIRNVAARATPTGRGSPRDKRRIDRFLAELAETSNVAAAAAVAELAVSNVYRLRRTDPAFAKRWYAALSEGYDNLEMELLQYLRGQDAGAGDPPVDGAKRKFDVAAALRCLTAHRESVALDPAPVGDAAHARIAALGLADPDAVLAPIALPGATRRPLSPVHGKLELGPDGSITLSWSRRARGAWLWRDAVEVPLGEQTEAYLVTLGDSAAPIAQWQVAEARLTIDAATVASLRTQAPHAPLEVRQRGDHDVSEALPLGPMP
ncbi:MAG TPA: hypothetical protein VM055_08890 [Novosphingobium sp.]|nr:hypothetical protein [Novosphingobium sp.]